MSENGKLEENTTEEKVAVKKAAPVKYKVLVNLSYNGNKVAAGEVVSDLPKESVGWLLKGKYIKKVT